MEKRELKNDGEILYLDSGNAAAIKAAQKYFNENGYTDGRGRPLEVDGDYGINTYNAVIKYQEDNGLYPDGKLGDKTWNSMWDKEEAEYKEWQKNSMWTWDRKNGNNLDNTEPEERNIPGTVTKDKLSVADKIKISTGFVGKALFDALGINSKNKVNNLDGEVEQKERENALRDREEPIVKEQDPFEVETSMGDRVEEWFN